MSLPQNWLDSLAKVQQRMGPAVIAGGAIRDTALNQPVSDVDIFVFNTKGFRDIANVLKDIPVAKQTPNQVPGFNGQGKQQPYSFSVTIQGTFSLDSAAAAPANNTYSNKNIVSVTDIFHLDGTAYQIIELTMEPIAYVETCFDIGICKAYTDGNKIVYTEDFYRDVTNKTLTICGTSSLYNTFHKHLPKLITKYPYPVLVDMTKITQEK